MSSIFNRYRTYILTFAAEALIVVMGFAVYRLANTKFDELGFSEYTLTRRSVSFIQPLLMMGLGVAIPRFTSFRNDKNSYLLTGVGLMLSIAAIFLMLFTVFRYPLASLMFGERQYAFLMMPLGLLLASTGFHAILYGFFRGKNFSLTANSLQLINIGVIPVAAFFLADSLVSLIYLSAIAVLAVCLVTTVATVLKGKHDWNGKVFIEDAKELLRYGLPRIPGDFALLALLTAPTYLVLNIQKDILLAGDIAYSLTLLNMTSAALAPVSLVLLPEIAQFLREEKYDLIRKRYLFFSVLTVVAITAAYVVFSLFPDFFLQILLGSRYNVRLADISRIVLLGSIGFGVYVVLRSMLDAIRTKAVNSFNLMISFGVYILLVTGTRLSDGQPDYYLYDFVASLTLLGALTFIQTRNTINQLKQ